MHGLKYINHQSFGIKKKQTNIIGPPYQTLLYVVHN